MAIQLTSVRLVPLCLNACIDKDDQMDEYRLGNVLSETAAGIALFPHLRLHRLLAVFDQEQVIKNWRRGRPGNGATAGPRDWLKIYSRLAVNALSFSPAYILKRF